MNRRGNLKEMRYNEVILFGKWIYDIFFVNII